VAVTVVDPKPVVTVAATNASAGEFGADKTIEFTFTRTGEVDSDLEIGVSFGGSATAGSDYSLGSAATSITPPVGFFMIPAGQNSGVMHLTVLPDEANESNETVMVSIQDGDTYYTGTPAVATGIIADKPSQEWAYAQLSGSPLSGPTDDADSDGRANLVEYFMKSQPGNGASSGIFQMMPPTQEGVFKVRYNRGKDLADVTGALEWSSDMIHWHGSGDNDGAHTLSITESVISSESADPQLIEATVTATNGGQPARIFVRLSVH